MNISDLVGLQAIVMTSPTQVGRIFNFVFLWHFIIFDTTVCAVIARAYRIHLTQLVRALIDRSMRSH